MNIELIIAAFYALALASGLSLSRIANRLEQIDESLRRIASVLTNMAQKQK